LKNKRIGLGVGYTPFALLLASIGGLFTGVAPSQKKKEKRMLIELLLVSKAAAEEGKGGR